MKYTVVVNNPESNIGNTSLWVKLWVKSIKLKYSLYVPIHSRVQWTQIWPCRRLLLTVTCNVTTVQFEGCTLIDIVDREKMNQFPRLTKMNSPDYNKSSPLITTNKEWGATIIESGPSVYLHFAKFCIFSWKLHPDFHKPIQSPKLKAADYRLKLVPFWIKVHCI